METSDYQQEVVTLLREIRDKQREALQMQEEQIALVKEQLQRSKHSIDESLSLQRTAIDRQRSVSLIAIPLIVACIALIAYQVVRYF